MGVIDLSQSYVCASAARWEYVAAIQNGSKLTEQMAKLEEERAGRMMAEANRDVLVEAIKKLEAELAEAKKRVTATKEKLVGTFGLKVERDKLKADLVDMTNKWMEKNQVCVQHEALMEKLSSMMNDLEEDIVSLQTDKEILEKEKKELERKSNDLEASAADARKQKLEAKLHLGKKLKEAEETVAETKKQLEEMAERAAEVAIEATRQHIRNREITERKLVRVAKVDTAKYLDLALRNKKHTPEEKWAKLEMYCKSVDVKIGEYDVDKYLNELRDLQISYPSCHLEKLKLRGDALGLMYNANGEAVEDSVVNVASDQKAAESVPVAEAKPDGERGTVE
ncbi:uncharacterized protein LOC133832037 [Humulus lupulus]|uniref:uncharacterized protein LOC133832037 n=1 Tax=Humulus lupulus TaxID=3486 RepID=UPI002B410788|nr:uncharacterized protein LOC133832037 [Humulus lupulus]